MTQEEFEQKVEHAAGRFDQRVEDAAARFEQRVEDAADRFDRGITSRWKNRSFRVAVKSVSVAAESGLLIAATYLSARGFGAAAACCFWLGLLGLACEVVLAIVFRQK